MFSYKDKNHQVVGPVSIEEIERLIREETLTRNSLLSSDGSDFWQPAYRFDELAAIFSQAQKDKEDQDLAAEKAAAVASATGQLIDVAAVVESEASNSDDPDENDAGSTEKKQTQAESSKPANDEKPVRYAFIGGDGREYGPVSFEQLRSWIRQRRADQNSRVRKEGDEEWDMLGNLPEFYSEFDEQTKKQQASPPPLDSSRANQIADQIIESGYNLNIAECFRRSWKMYTENFGILTGTTALVIIILSFLNSIAGAGNIAGFALGGVFIGGLSWGFLKIIRGGKMTVQDTFEGFTKCFVPLLLASILTSVFVITGLALCILPGVYLFVAWLFVYPLVFELRLDFWPAMELSRKVVHERWWELFGLTFGIGMLTLLGVLLFGIGVFFTTPLAIGAIMYAYDDIFRKYSDAGKLNSNGKEEDPGKPLPADPS